MHIYTGEKPKPAVAGVQYFKLGTEIELENGAGNVLINRTTTKTFREDRDYLQPIPIQERQNNKTCRRTRNG